MTLFPTNGKGETILDRKTRITLGLAIIIVMALISVAGFAYGQNTKIALTEQKVTELESDMDDTVSQREFELHTTSIDNRLENIENSQLRIEDKFDTYLTRRQQDS